MLRPALCLLVCALLAACGATGQSATAPPPTDEPSEAPSSPSEEILPPSVAELTRSVVYIEAIDDSGDGFTGSGTLISADGLILTNAHVAAPWDDGRDYELTVGLTLDESSAPTPDLTAQLLAADAVLDLALIQIDAGAAGEEAYPFLPLGDSDGVAIGDEVHVLGYPGIGGGTITYSSGQISGFTSDATLGDRAWIKTDATIAGGNSGGAATNDAGELIAVPTQAGAGDDGPLVDCRVVTDTNGDDAVDEQDTCVPIGGFLNGLRPVAWADDMLAAVERGVAYEPIGGLEQPGEERPDFSLDEVVWSDAIMTTAVDEADEPVDQVESLPSSADELCAVWTYEGMQPGMLYDAVWLVDGEIDEEISYLAQTWALDEAGSYWICTFTEGGELGDGFYEAVVIVEDEVMGSGWAFVGDEYAPVSWSIGNGSADVFCFVYVSPVAAPGWGSDRLGASEVLGSGEQLDLMLPAGEYDVQVTDCDGAVLQQTSTVVEEGGLLLLE